MAEAMTTRTRLSVLLVSTPLLAFIVFGGMGKASGGKGPAQFMSTHPSHETRIRQFQQWMPEALKIKGEKCAV